MSPSSKSKSKDKSTPKTVKEQSKVSMKSFSSHSNAGNGSSAGVYNPALGTFHNVETSHISLSTPQYNGRFRATDVPDDFGSSPGTTVEYDSLSNNSSCSGESAEEQREKPTSPPARIDAIPGSDTDKREKIRQKNERKHQRQKERRAQELHERCCALVISRKVEALSNQLVSMGFPADRATTAIIMNEGRMEESVAWLLHEVEEEDNTQQSSAKVGDKSHMKIDITEELARVAELVLKYKCTKQDVERAVVSTEGDLLKAEQNLVLQKHSATPLVTQKLDESIDFVESRGATTGINQQMRQDGRDLNQMKSVAPKNLPQDSANTNLQQSAKRIQPNPTDWCRAQVAAADKKWLAISSAPSSSYPLSPTVQASGAQIKQDPSFGLMMGNEVRTSFQSGGLKETLAVLQRHKQTLPSSSIGMGVNGSTLQHFYHQNNLLPPPVSSVPAEFSASAGWNGGQTWNASGSHSSLAMPSSLGLFSGRSSVQNGWNTGGFATHRDYTSVDWSLDLPPLRSSLNSDFVSKTWSTMFMGGNAATHLVNGGDGVHLSGLQEAGGITADSAASSTPRGWSNPFEGRDLLRVSRQHVTFPSL